MANTYLSRTLTSTGNRKLWTWSAWIKKGISDGTEMGLFGLYEDGANYFRIRYKSDQRLGIDNVEGNTTTMNLILGTEHRDVSGWYHLVVKYDSAQSTASNRVKIYVNNVLQTEFQATTYPSQNANTYFPVNALPLNVGRTTNNKYFDGSMSHIHFTDGYAYDASAFGEYDANGVWTIKTSPSVTYGTNGFFILKDGNSVTDQSGEGNNFTVGGGTLTNTEDNPSNVFCTYNPLQQTNGGAGFQNGNNYFTNTTQWLGVNGTIAATSGKYYAEFKVTGSNSWGIGVSDVDSDANRTDLLSSANNGYQSKYTGGKQIFLNGSTIIAMENNSTVVDNAGMGNTSFVSGDIVMLALDLNNNNLFFGKNGTWLRGATESEIEAGTSTNATFSGTSFNDKFWTFGVCSETENMYANFGNGYFATTAVSSAGTNASGIGIFEYDVPTGFTALSTKGLNL